MQSFFRLYKL